MMKPKKKWSQMTAEELAAATREFDRPDYEPAAQKPTQREMAQLHRVQRRSMTNRFRIALSLEKNLVEAADNYAAAHGVSFSEVVSDALRLLMAKKPA